MNYQCPACKQNIRRDGRRGKTVESYCALTGKNVTLRKVVKKMKAKR
jgi:hypothetical protein